MMQPLTAGGALSAKRTTDPTQLHQANPSQANPSSEQHQERSPGETNASFDRSPGPCVERGPTTRMAAAACAAQAVETQGLDSLFAVSSAVDPTLSALSNIVRRKTIRRRLKVRLCLPIALCAPNQLRGPSPSLLAHVSLVTSPSSASPSRLRLPSMKPWERGFVGEAVVTTELHGAGRPRGRGGQMARRE